VSIVLWILQILLAVVFLLAGAVKAFQSYDTLAARMPWVEDYSPTMVRVIGGLEILGALGLLLPGLLGSLPILTPVAAVGLAVIMVLAFLRHMARGENGQMGFTAVLFALLLLLAVGRFLLAPL